MPVVRRRYKIFIRQEEEDIEGAVATDPSLAPVAAKVRRKRREHPPHLLPPLRHQQHAPEAAALPPSLAAEAPIQVRPGLREGGTTSTTAVDTSAAAALPPTAATSAAAAVPSAPDLGEPDVEAADMVPPVRAAEEMEEHGVEDTAHHPLSPAVDALMSVVAPAAAADEEEAAGNSTSGEGASSIIMERVTKLGQQQQQQAEAAQQALSHREQSILAPGESAGLADAIARAEGVAIAGDVLAAGLGALTSRSTPSAVPASGGGGSSTATSEEAPPDLTGSNVLQGVPELVKRVKDAVLHSLPHPHHNTGAAAAEPGAGAARPNGVSVAATAEQPPLQPQPKPGLEAAEWDVAGNP